MEKLPEELHLEFIQIYDERSDTLPFELEETFVDGFRLGAQMMLDVLLGGEMKNKAYPPVSGCPKQGADVLHLRFRSAWGPAKAFRGTIHWMVPPLCLLTFFEGRFASLLACGGSSPPHPVASF